MREGLDFQILFRIFNLNKKVKVMKNIHKINNNIYITSDEEIKDGDWMIRGNEQPTLVTPNFFWDFGVRYYKIILTTDKDLNGVQAIDDEFLEWFVKNPSCEFVEIIPSEFLADKVIYEINIPQEEPKQETLEEAAQKYLNEKYQKGGYLGNLFIEGAKSDAAKDYWFKIFKEQFKKK
jgi:hypothetical protein